MSDFKKGDIINNLNNPYNTHYHMEGMEKAKVIYVNGYPATMGIEILEHKNSEFIGKCVEVECRSKWFNVIN